MSIAEKEREMFGILLLNHRHRLIEFTILFKGTLDSSPVHPREVVKLCIAHNASAVILAHNHPSHDPEPSQADIRVTEKLKNALELIDVSVLDHFIIGGTLIELIYLYLISLKERKSPLAAQEYPYLYLLRLLVRIIGIMLNFKHLQLF